MWIKSLRLKEVGKFSSGHSVEGLKPGLNVLIGSNEYGKSTLLRAMLVLFEYPHTSNHANVRGLRPYSGGAPQIVCELNHGGTDWLLRKQYLTSRSAELRTLNGEQLHRGGDVDSALTVLIEEAAGSLATLKLQWVPQGEGFRPPRVSAEAVTTIHDLVSAEVTAATGGTQVSGIIQSVSDYLATMITAKSRRPKAGGPLHEAQRELKSVTEVLEDLKFKEAANAERLARFNEIFAELNAAETTNDLAHLNEQILARREGIKAAQERIAQCELVTERRKRKAVETDAADTALRDYSNRIKAYDQRQLRVRELKGALDQNLAEAEVRQARLAECTKEFSHLEAQQEDYRQGEIRKQLRERHSELVARVDEAQQRLQVVLDVEEKLLANGAQLKSYKVAREAFESALQLSQEIERLSIELKAQSATLEVDYLPDRAASISINAEELADRTTVAIECPTVVDIPGIGQLRIVPGLNQEVADVKSRLELSETRLAQLLQENDCGSLNDLETAWRERSRLEAERDHLQESLKQLAPTGSQSFKTALSELREQVDTVKLGLQDVDLGDDDRLIDRSTALNALSNQLKLIQHDSVRQEERAQQLRSELLQLEERNGQSSEQELSDPSRRDAKVRQLKDNFEMANEALNLVVRQEHALLDGMPTREEIAQVIEAVERQELELRSKEEQLAALREEASVLQGALRRDTEDGLGARVQEVAEEQFAAQAKVEELQLEVAALELLGQELGAIADDRQRFVTQPVVQRIAEIAGPLFPDVTFGMGGDLELNTVKRRGIDEGVSAISGGTLEQVSVLARLAFADLLYEGGFALPVVLDDPFVYSDDARLENLFKILQGLSDRHQIIVMTCHRTAFLPLISKYGANEVMLGDWTG